MLPPGEKKEIEPPDWGEAFTVLLAHTSIPGIPAIRKMTIPQIEAIIARLGKQINLGMGVPYSAQTTVKDPDAEHSIDEAMAFCALFTGIE
ncbi:MAG: hypothetical protein WC231_05405 [Dehalococcoidales bacterium]